MTAPSPERLPSLRIQIVAYRNDADQVHRLIESLGVAVRYARVRDALREVEMRVGDAAETPELSALDGSLVASWCAAAGLEEAAYDFFGANLGSAGGNNRLAAGARTDFLLLCNPDTYAAPAMIERLLASVEPGVAAVEARQVPAEHPKAYDVATHRAEWVSCAALLLLRSAFDEVGGFDADYFFLHGDDVDLSWRLRLAGYELVTALDAVTFHDKRLTREGRVFAPDAERYHHIHSRMMLARRYGLSAIAGKTRSWVEERGDAVERKALAEFDRRVAGGNVPDVLSEAHRIVTADRAGLTRRRF